MRDGHLHFLFGKMSIQFLCPVLNWVVWFFDVELYELRTDIGKDPDAGKD